MRALVVDHQAPGRLALREVAEPKVAANQALVRVQAISLNRGEVNRIARADAGTLLGWDAAWTVIEPAAGGGGPAAGTRVVTWGADGAWAERRAVATDNLAVLPDGVDVGAASALPVAGVTALRALRVCGAVVGRRVLVTGAAGGVGRFAVQLAHRAGAHVIAVVGSEARGTGLAALGADEVVVGIDTLQAPVFAVLDNVGGPGLAAAFRLLAPGGMVVCIGAASGQETVLPAGSTTGPRRSLFSFQMVYEGGPLGADLSYLVALLDAHELDPQVDWRGGWDRAGEATRLLLDRKINGKAVLDVA
jgi:NADPH:quinone reductase-like Zn-dependent oxidoreductase